MTKPPAIIVIALEGPTVEEVERVIKERGWGTLFLREWPSNREQPPAA